MILLLMDKLLPFEISLPIIVIGGGGHAGVVIDTLLENSCKILGFTNLSKDINYFIHGIPYLGDDSIIENYDPKSILLTVGIGSIKSFNLRGEIFEKWKAKGYSFVTIIHPSAIVSKRAMIGEGAQILMGATVQAGVIIKENCILNTNCSVDHNCELDAHCHISPGVIISGSVKIGSYSHIGVGSIITQGLSVGQNATVGAGALVLKDVPSSSLVVGLPAMVKKGVHND
jgi:sugar O-acyltransferase (sialic acid O-acetyltransferase NeuD family)